MFVACTLTLLPPGVLLLPNILRLLWEGLGPCDPPGVLHPAIPDVLVDMVAVFPAVLRRMGTVARHTGLSHTSTHLILFGLLGGRLGD